jgi:hypothetical protein
LKEKIEYTPSLFLSDMQHWRSLDERIAYLNLKHVLKSNNNNNNNNNNNDNNNNNKNNNTCNKIKV